MRRDERATKNGTEALAARIKAHRERRDFWTVGNPLVYEPALDRGDCMKAVGGVVFLEERAAASVLENGYLPHWWYRKGHAPFGRVYRLTLPGSLADCTRKLNALRVLTVPAVVSRVAS